MALLLVAALYLALGAVFLHVEVLSTAQSPTGASVGDLVSYYYPMLRYGFGQLRSGSLPLWNPHQLAGAPLFASPVIGFFYPPYASYFLVSPETAITVDVVLHLAIAGLTMYLLCRGLGMGAAPAIVAGIVFAYQGGMLVKLHYPGYLASVVWLPAIVLLVYRVLEGPSPRRCASLAAVFGVSLLGGHGLQFAYFIGWTLVPLIVYHIARRLRDGEGRAVLAAIAALAVALALGTALAAVRIIPGAELAHESWRPPGSLAIETAAEMSADPGTFLRNLVSAEPSGHPGMAHAFPGMLREGYVGIVPLAMAVAGLLLWHRRGLAIAFGTVAAGAALYAVGPHTFVFPALFHLPFGAWFRGPDRALAMFGFGVAVLCGAGLDEITLRGRAWVVALLALAAIAAAALLVGRSAGAWQAVGYCAAGAAVVGTIAFTRTSGIARSAAVVVLAALALVDLWRGSPVYGALPSQLGGYFARLNPFFDDIRARQGLDRTYIWASFRPDDPLFFFSDVAKAGQMHGLWLPTDYEGLASARIERYLRFLAPGSVAPERPIDPFGYFPLQLAPSNARLASLLGIRFFLVQDGDKARYIDPSLDVDRAWRVLRREGGVTLYENPDPVPRAFVAPRIVTVPDSDRLLDQLSTIDPRTVALVEEPLALPGSGSGDQPGEARITAYTPGRVVVEATAPPGGGLLVLTDQFYPGWTATIDGQPAPIHRADYLFRGVLLPAGSHRVEFLYWPASFRIGATVSALALVAIVLLAVAGRARYPLSRFETVNTSSGTPPS